MLRRNLPLLVVISIFLVVLVAVLTLKNSHFVPISLRTTPTPSATEISPILPPATERELTFLPIIELQDSGLSFLPAVLNSQQPVKEELRPVPFFAQADPRWGSTLLNGCEPWYTLGSHGCALTSAAMVFSYYGVDTNPRKLNQCMQGDACPFIWWDGATNCSDGKVKYVKRMPFSWEKLDNQLNGKKRPVVLCLYWAAMPQYGHCMVVVSGSGDSRRGYYVNDPGKLTGNMRLDVAAAGGVFTEMIIYDNQ